MANPDNEMVIKEGVTVYAADGKIGSVKEVKRDPATGKVTGFTVGKGLMFSDDIDVPVEMVQSATDQGIDLNVNRDALERKSELEVERELGHDVLPGETNPNQGMQADDGEGMDIYASDLTAGLNKNVVETYDKLYGQPSSNPELIVKVPDHIAGYNPDSPVWQEGTEIAHEGVEVAERENDPGDVYKRIPVSEVVKEHPEEWTDHIGFKPEYWNKDAGLGGKIE